MRCHRWKRYIRCLWVTCDVLASHQAVLRHVGILRVQPSRFELRFRRQRDFEHFKWVFPDHQVIPQIADSGSLEPNTAQDASSAAASCLNSVPSGGVFTPTAISAIASATATSSGTSASGSGSSAAISSPSKGAAVSRTELGLWTPLSVGLAGVVLGGVWAFA